MEKQSRKYDAVVFDLDGTLLDTLDDLTASVNAAMEACGIRKYTRNEVRSFVGNGIHKLIERAVPGGEENSLFQSAYDLFKSHYAVHCMDLTEPYPGIMDLLARLKEQGYRTAIVSNKADFAVKKLNEQYFNGLVDTAVGEQEGIRKKPEPDMVNLALHGLDVPAERAVYIGDSEVDIRTAGNASMDSIIVTWGFRERDFLREQGAGKIAENAEELLYLIEGNMQNRQM